MKAFGSSQYSPTNSSALAGNNISRQSPSSYHHHEFGMNGNQSFLNSGGNLIQSSPNNMYHQSSSYLREETGYKYEESPRVYDANSYIRDLGFSVEHEKQKLRDIEQTREKIKQRDFNPSLPPSSSNQNPTFNPPSSFTSRNEKFDYSAGKQPQPSSNGFNRPQYEEKRPQGSNYGFYEEPSNRYQFEEDAHHYSSKGNEQSVEFLSVRIAALEEIIEIQNNEINEFNKNQDGKDDFLKKGKHNLQISILNKWRQKVYALLIQSKMADIEDENQAKEFRKKELEFQKEIKQLKYELSVARHKEKDLKASNNYLEEQLKKLDISKYVKEIERLNREKEFMGRKFEQDLKVLKEDRNLLEEQKKNHMEEIQRKFDSLNKEVEVVRNEYNLKCSEVEKLTLSLTRAEQTIATELGVVKTLKSKLNEYQHQNDKEKKDIVLHAVRLKDEELTRLEIELNEAKSENTKLVYKLKHYERLIQAEQESKHKEDREKFDYYEMKISVKEEEIKQLKKERGSLLLTIRHQEDMLENRRRSDKPLLSVQNPTIDTKASSIIPTEYLSFANNIASPRRISPKSSPKPPPTTVTTRLAPREPVVSSPNSLSEKLKDLSSLTKKFLDKSKEHDDEYL